MTQRLEKRNQLKPLGSHTALGFLHETQKWKDIPYLKDNEGLLPPFIIAVGSRLRVLAAPEILKLKNPVFIDQEAINRFGVSIGGRINLLVGTFSFNEFEFPLAVVETQMGCPATQINMKEALYFSHDEKYQIGEGRVDSDGIYVVRAGTCAGVNSHKKSELQISIGDILIANESYGSIGAVAQSVLGLLSFTNVQISQKFEELRHELSSDRILSLSHDLFNLKTRSSSRLLLQLQRAADSLGVRNFVGPNFTKDSLYAEIGEDGFAWLRDTYGIISTEMEQLVLDISAAEFTKAGIPVHSGLISAAIGAIPGKSFPETDLDKKDAKEAEENIMRVAALALRDIALGLNR